MDTTGLKHRVKGRQTHRVLNAHQPPALRLRLELVDEVLQKICVLRAGQYMDQRGTGRKAVRELPHCYLHLRLGERKNRQRDAAPKNIKVVVQARVVHRAKAGNYFRVLLSRLPCVENIQIFNPQTHLRTVSGDTGVQKSNLFLTEAHWSGLALFCCN